MLVGFLFIGYNGMAQTEANIANTSVQLKGDKVQIKYDILNTDKAAWFIVSVAISDSDGNRLDVNALDGDIGEVLKAGKNKVIVWDPVADSIFLNATIDIQVYAEMVLPPQIIEPEPEIQAEIEDNKPSEQDSSNEYFAEDENQNEKKSKKDNEEVLNLPQEKRVVTGMNLTELRSFFSPLHYLDSAYQESQKSHIG